MTAYWAPLLWPAYGAMPVSVMYVVMNVNILRESESTLALSKA